jgi:protease I
MKKPRIAILLERGFQEEEFIYPYYRCLEEGYKAQIVSPYTGTIRGKHGFPTKIDRHLLNEEQASTICKDYDGVIIPGGFECPDRLRSYPQVLSFVRRMDEENKLIAAICHGPWVLISAGIVAGRNMTGFKTLKTDLENAGAIYHDDPVVVDHNIITSPHYRNNGDFMREVVRWVNERQLFKNKGL